MPLALGFFTLTRILFRHRRAQKITCGISTHVISWCREYLVDRKQSIKNGMDISNELRVEYSVPPGSILGPLFFIIYVNYLVKNFDELDPKITLYADDIVIYVSSNLALDTCTRLGNGLAKPSKWCGENSINVKKTKLLIVDQQNDVRNYPKPKLNGHYLDLVHSYNYLGVSIDDKMVFDNLLSEKYGKVHSQVYQLSRMRKYIDENTVCLIYKQMIVPLSDYADIIVKSGPMGEVSRLD